MLNKIKCLFGYHKIKKIPANIPWLAIRDWEVCTRPCCGYRALFEHHHSKFTNRSWKEKLPDSADGKYHWK